MCDVVALVAAAARLAPLARFRNLPVDDCVVLPPVESPSGDLIGLLVGGWPVVVEYEAASNLGAVSLNHASHVVLRGYGAVEPVAPGDASPAGSRP